LVVAQSRFALHYTRLPIVHLIPGSWKRLQLPVTEQGLLIAYRASLAILASWGYARRSCCMFSEGRCRPSLFSFMILCLCYRSVRFLSSAGCSGECYWQLPHQIFCSSDLPSTRRYSVPRLSLMPSSLALASRILDASLPVCCTPALKALSMQKDQRQNSEFKLPKIGDPQALI
jgi:hypothetical protein